MIGRIFFVVRMALLGLMGVAAIFLLTAADVSVDPIILADGCRQWTICDDQEAGTTCIDSDSDTNVVRAGNEYTWSAWTTDSDATTAWTVKLYDRTPGSGSHASKRVLINSVGDMKPANQKFSWNGLSGDIVAVLGGVLAPTPTSSPSPTPGVKGVTVVIKGCPLTH